MAWGALGHLDKLCKGQLSEKGQASPSSKGGDYQLGHANTLNVYYMPKIINPSRPEEFCKQGRLRDHGSRTSLNNEQHE